MTLVVVGMISTLAISFAGSMATQIQVARDQAAAVHAELTAQSGLEYASRRLLLDPLWHGTSDLTVHFADGAQFDVTRLAGVESRLLPTEVKLEVQGRRSAATAMFRIELLVDPGDPLLDKAFSTLGDIVGSNILIDGDYLILDAPGWLWSPRSDLDGKVGADTAITAPPDPSKSRRLSQQVTIDKRTATDIASELNFGFNADGWPDLSRLGNLSHTEITAFKAKYQAYLDSMGAKVDIKAAPTLDSSSMLLHVRKQDSNVEGVWERSPHPGAETVSLSRIDSKGTLHKFSSQAYSFAARSLRSKQPVHAPSWDLDPYLVPGPGLKIYNRVTSLVDVSIPETAVFVLAPGQTLRLENVEFKGGMVVYCEKDFDFTGPPRNQVTLAGSNIVGDALLGGGNEALMAPGCSFTVTGAGKQQATGFSMIHSLNMVQRLHHKGVLIILNSATELHDSQFDYQRQVAVAPPESITFFGNLPGVIIQDVQEHLNTGAKP